MVNRRSYFKTVYVKTVNDIFPSISNKFLILLLGILISPLIIYRYLMFYIPYAEVVVTPKCNLRCEGCANLMNYYSDAQHADMDLIKRSVTALLGVCGGINTVKLIGGEPFLYPDLYELMEVFNADKKIKNIIITTNGTVVPKGNMLQCLKNDKVEVNISKYSNIKSERLVEVLAENKINHKIIEFESWYDYGGIEKRNFSERVLRRSFSECASAECKSILNGRLFACPRATHGYELGVADNEHFADLINTPKNKLRREIKKLYSLPYTQACDHCNPVWERQEIECARQI